MNWSLVVRLQWSRPISLMSGLLETSYGQVSFFAAKEAMLTILQPPFQHSLDRHRVFLFSMERACLQSTYNYFQVALAVLMVVSRLSVNLPSASALSVSCLMWSASLFCLGVSCMALFSVARSPSSRAQPASLGLKWLTGPGLPNRCHHMLPHQWHYCWSAKVHCERLCVCVPDRDRWYVKTHLEWWLDCTSVFAWVKWLDNKNRWSISCSLCGHVTINP